MRGAVALALIAIAATTGGCLKTASFACTDSTDCTRGGGPGVCEASGFCSFDDATCDGGRRYGDLSGPFAGQCVGGSGPDAMPDSPDAAPGCFGAGIVQVCPDTQPTMPVTLSGTINTDASPMCVPFTSSTGTSACLVAGQGITVSATLTATGTKPLVLVSSTTITIASGATLDVSSRRDPSFIGAGANSPMCTLGTDATLGGTGGGGWAGSFGGAGGNGGDGGDGAAPGLGGIAAAASGVPSTLRGGCAGSNGAGTLGGGGGRGGGAVYLIANQQIQVDGAIDASGASGTGGGLSNEQPGGGGGGSGGMIGLEAPMVAITGAVFANGGGGGEGGGTGFAGVNGTESIGPAAAGVGGAGPTIGLGGDGGNGSSGVAVGGVAGMLDTSDGGGGGGGGAGAIRIFASQISGTANVAPPPS